MDSNHELIKMVEHLRQMSTSRPERTAPASEAPSTIVLHPPRGTQPEARGTKPPTFKESQLPLWSEERRGVPNDLVRSALFTIGHRDERRHFKRERIAALGNIELLYTGEELRQKDEDVFLQLMHYQRLQRLGDHVEFSAHDMLKNLGWTTGSRGYQDLQQSIERLKATSLQVTATDKYTERSFAGSLIRSFAYRKSLGVPNQRWRVTFEPAILTLFGHVAYSQIDWEQRLKLSPLAKWLHSFYHTHRDPFPMKDTTIHTLCGSATKDRSKFRQLLRGALRELQGVGFLDAAEVDLQGMVRVRRMTTKA